MSYFIQMHKVAIRVLHVEELWSQPHLHTHLEMIYLEEGSCEVLLDNQRYAIEAGDILLAFPNQIHAYYEKTPVRGYVVMFAPEIFQEFREIFQSKRLENPILQEHRFTMNVGQCLNNMKDKLKMDMAFGEVVAKGQLLALLGEMFLCMNFIDKPGETEAMKRILNYCMERFAEPFTLDEMAKELYLSKYYICHMFRERLNVNCKEFVNQLRVEAACDLLKKDASVTETAYAVGFSSVRTFNRIFSHYMNMSPTDYKKIKKHIYFLYESAILYKD
ncbi:MAG: helix-turn-helix transcriptional regulator [Tyzzerella sp.]|nr:helix-turn-helix transcriptional regulator [Tyzzerella sp.]